MDELPLGCSRLGSLSPVPNCCETMQIGTSLIAWFFFLPLFVGGLAPRSSSSLDRRQFLHKGANAIATSLIVPGVASVVAPSSAKAIDIADVSLFNKKNKKLIQPAPNSLQGKVIVITGASTGLGLESAKRLAVAGATLVLTARSVEKCERMLSQVKSYLAERGVMDTPPIYTVVLNLDNMDSVKSFPERLRVIMGKTDESSPPKIDCLMNNAGVAAIPEKEMTVDGFEKTFQTNHLGPFVLTAGLYPYFNRSGTRIINVSSTAHMFSFLPYTNQRGLDIEGNLNGQTFYDGWAAYSQSKLENIYFTQELQRRADAAGQSWLTAVALHPGVIGTDIWRNTALGSSTDQTMESRTRNPFQGMLSQTFYRNALSIEEGANTQVWLASAPTDALPNDTIKGQFIDPHQHIQRLSDFARDAARAQKLWECSENDSGVRFVVQ